MVSVGIRKSHISESSGGVRFCEDGRIFDQYSAEEFYQKQKVLDILPIKFKFIFNYIVLFYKIVNSLVPISLPK